MQAEIKRREELVQTHHSEIQKIQIQRETDLDTERRQRQQIEREYQDKLLELQTKMELAIKEREIEVREGLDERNKSNKSRYTGELQKAHEMISQREGELDTLERQNVQLVNEKRQLEQSLLKAEEQMQEL